MTRPSSAKAHFALLVWYRDLLGRFARLPSLERVWSYNAMHGAMPARIISVRNNRFAFLLTADQFTEAR